MTEKPEKFSLFPPKAPKSPKMPSAAQFREARAAMSQAEISTKKISEYSIKLGLPVDASAIRSIEKGEEPSPPTRLTDKADYFGHGEFYQKMPYPERLRLVYMMLGIVFLPDDKVVRVDPMDLWGPFAELDRDWRNPHLDGPTVDVARKLIDNAYNKAKGNA